MNPSKETEMMEIGIPLLKGVEVLTTFHGRQRQIIIFRNQSENGKG